MRQGLLSAIRAAPDDHAPRLVYADWLQERGDPVRADFVRAQLERATLPPWEERHLELEVQEHQWLVAHGERWREELPDLEGVTWGRFHRGIADRVRFHGLGFFEDHAEACTQASALDAMVIGWPRFGERPSLEPARGIRELCVDGPVYDGGSVDWLAGEEAVSSLRSLSLSRSFIDGEPYGRLVASPHLAALTSLDVRDHQMGDEVLVRLVREGTVRALTHLQVAVPTPAERGSQAREAPVLGVDGLRALAEWEGATSLRSLDLTGNQIGDPGLREVLSSAGLSGLQVLKLEGIWDAVESLTFDGFSDAHSDLCLKSLSLGDLSLNEAGATALADARCLSTLEELQMPHVFAEGAAVARRLLAAPWFDHVRVLGLGGVGVGWLHALAERAPERVHTLHLNVGWLQKKKAIRALADSPVAGQLRSIVFAYADDEALGELIDTASAFGQLLSVQVGVNHSEIEAPRLVNSALGTQLERLELGRSPIMRDLLNPISVPRSGP